MGMPLNAPDLLSRLLSARTTAQVEAIMAGLPIVPAEQFQWLSDTDRAGNWQQGNLHWVPVGRDRGNGGRIKLAGEPMNPLAERLVNGMEALIELARLREVAKNPKAPMPPSPREAVLRYFGFPRLDQIERLDEDERKAKSVMADKVRKDLSIKLDFEKKTKQFAVTVRDHGMGQAPENVHRTLLSLGRTEKADKPYLIGVFGQGGSSAFSIAKYSVVVSRRAGDIRNQGEGAGVGWSIVKEIQPKGRRDPYFAYLAATEEGGVPAIDTAQADKFDQGAHFCHIAYDFGASESSIARLMYQSLNHVLFNPVMPYELYALKDTPDPMKGTAQRLSQRVRRFGSTALDKSFTQLPVV
jgi:hypothetical protein